MPSRKGSPNKVSAAVKENILAVFTRLGGTAAMAKWAEANQGQFYPLYCRLAPTDITVEVNQSDTKELSREELIRIAASGSAGVAGSNGRDAESPALH